MLSTAFNCNWCKAMKIKPHPLFTSVVCWLMFGGLVRTAELDGWSDGLKSRDAASIRAAAMLKIAEFAETFADNPLAQEARTLVQQDTMSTDPNAWISATVQFVAHVLKSHGPMEANMPIREAALEILDYPLHVDNQQNDAPAELKSAWQRAVGEYYQSQMRQAITQIKTSRVDQGLTVWKLYNMGFVVKSKRHTIGFDIALGQPTPLDAAQIDSLVDCLDIVFVSHAHDDHFHAKILGEMLRAGRRVVLPTPAAADILRVAQLDGRNGNIVRAYDDYKQPVDIGGATIRCFPGRQDRNTPCSVYAVTLDGHTVAHNGDNTDVEAYGKITGSVPVDVLLANCWSGLLPYINLTKPQLVLTGHENELGHAVSHRISYLNTFQCLNGAKDLPRTVVLAWGEHVAYVNDCAAEARNGQVPKIQSQMARRTTPTDPRFVFRRIPVEASQR